MNKVLLLTTSNQNKVKELKAAFQRTGLDIEIKTNADLEVAPHVSGNSSTFEENAALKAHTLAEFSKLPTLSDGPGLAVDRLNGAPGVHSTRYGGEAHNDARNSAKLLALLGGILEEERFAEFCSTFALSVPGHFDKDLIVISECEGMALVIPHGHDGFGYDLSFYALGKGKIFAEMTTDEKNEISYRGKVLKQLVEKLPAWLEQS